MSEFKENKVDEETKRRQKIARKIDECVRTR